jgi:hypothetical protein
MLNRKIINKVNMIISEKNVISANVTVENEIDKSIFLKILGKVFLKKTGYEK